MNVCPAIPVGLLVAHSNNRAQPVSAYSGPPQRVSEGGVSFLAWEVNNVDVAATRDPQDRYFFQVQEEFDADTHSNVRVHGTDGRTIFPAPDVPGWSCP